MNLLPYVVSQISRVIKHPNQKAANLGLLDGIEPRNGGVRANLLTK